MHYAHNTRISDFLMPFRWLDRCAFVRVATNLSSGQSLLTTKRPIFHSPNLRRDSDSSLRSNARASPVPCITSIVRHHQYCHQQHMYVHGENANLK